MVEDLLSSDQTMVLDDSACQVMTHFSEIGCLVQLDNLNYSFHTMVGSLHSSVLETGM